MPPPQTAQHHGKTAKAKQTKAYTCLRNAHTLHNAHAQGSCNAMYDNMHKCILSACKHFYATTLNSPTTPWKNYKSKVYSYTCTCISNAGILIQCIFDACKHTRATTSKKPSPWEQLKGAVCESKPVDIHCTGRMHNMHLQCMQKYLCLY